MGKKNKSHSLVETFHYHNEQMKAQIGEGYAKNLGEPFEGSHHDKAIHDQAELVFPDQLRCLWATVAR